MTPAEHRLRRRGHAVTIDIPWQSPSQRLGFHRLLDALEVTAATYQLTGAVAGNVHGSRWPVHDVDVDVTAADLPRVLDVLGDAVHVPLHRFLDDEFDLLLATATLEGLSVDLGQVEDARVHASTGAWVPLRTVLERRERHAWEGRTIWVQPLADLVAYKRLLGRAADVEDLERRLSLSDRDTCCR